jgi:SAM-dependent methyltransferase
VSAIEPDERRFAWAEARIRGHAVDVDLTRANAELLPFESSHFHIVTFDSVIEHVADPTTVVSEVCRVLAPCGIVYLVSPSRSSLLMVRRDPHYGMFGVVLMPRWLGRWYVEDVRRHSRGYWVNFIPPRRWLEREFHDGGVTLVHQPPKGLTKLSDPAQIDRHLGIRRLARVARALGATNLLRRVAIAQEPTHTYIGRKAPAR